MDRIFHEIWKEENENLIRFYQGDLDICASAFQLLYKKFEDKDNSLFNEIFPEIKSKITDNLFRNRIVTIENGNYKEQKQNLIKNRINDNDLITNLKLTLFEKNIKELTFEKLISDFDQNFDAVISQISTIKSDIDYYKNNFQYYSIAKILYDDYKKRTVGRFSVPENCRLLNLYHEHGIDLKLTDKQFNRYKLLTIDENFEIKISALPKVYDTRIKTHLIIQHVSPQLLEVLNKLNKEGVIGSLALRPEYNIVALGLSDISPIFEDIERGEIFSFEKLSTSMISKLYSYDNSSLWIVNDGENITFEELLDNFETEQDNIVTQVLHLEYSNVKGSYLISHIDHEYIFYTVDEYEKRKRDHRQKGEARSRFKTFKIDKAKISFVMKNGDCLLFTILNEYFHKKELLIEYFQKVRQTT